MIRTTIVVTAALALLVAATSRADDEQKARAEKIKKLQKQHHDLLKKVLAVRKKQFETNRCSREAVFEAAKKLLEMELELATTTEQRVAAHAARLELAKDMEERMEARLKAALADLAEVLDTKAYRLEVEIAWLKAGGKEKKGK